MRIISGLAAGVAAMAIGSAAEARPGGAGPGQGASPPGVWFKNSGHHGVKGGYSHFGPGAIRGDRRHGRFDRHGRGGFNPYFGGGIAGPVGEVDPYGNGFFNGGGGRIRLRGGRPYYDYDRAYPYEWASSARAREPDRADEERGTQSPPARCTFENEVRVCRGW